MSDQQIPKQIIGLSRLAQLEWDIRQAGEQQDLDYIAVNDVHRIIAFDHALVWRERSKKMTAVSGGLTLEQTAPQIVYFAKLGAHCARRSAQSSDSLAPVRIEPAELPRNLSSEFAERVPSTAIWVPLALANGYSDGGMILLRAEPLTESEQRILARVANALAHTAVALGARINAPWHWRTSPGLRIAAALCIASLIGFLPVRLSVLADATVVAVDPILVTAPLDGVIQDISVEPNDGVLKGQRLFHFDQTELNAKFDVAAKRVAVLKVDAQKTEQQAFEDPKARGDIGLLRARLAEGRAELEYARERLAQVVVAAPEAGTVLFDDKNTWLGRPVKIGERIMSVADPAKAKLRINIPVDDALIVEPGTEVEFFLTIAPTNPVLGRLTKVSYDARLLPNQTTAFTAEAEFDSDQGTPRLGLTGTAKVYGQRAPLAYALLRKPLATIRRFIGF